MKYFGKEWYYNCCNNEKGKEYLSYSEKCLPRWYNDFSIHDSKIEKICTDEKAIVLYLIDDDYLRTKYQIILHNPTVIESCNLIGSWCISDEVYIDNGLCEYHLMVDNCDSGKQVLDYFTVKCSEIEVVYNGKSHFIINNINDGDFYEIK